MSSSFQMWSATPAAIAARGDLGCQDVGSVKLTHYRVVLGMAFEELKLHRVIGRLEARNTASARVLEGLGMRREAHFGENEYVKGEWQSELDYAILDREWPGS